MIRSGQPISAFRHGRRSSFLNDAILRHKKGHVARHGLNTNNSIFYYSLFFSLKARKNKSPEANVHTNRNRKRNHLVVNK